MAITLRNKEVEETIRRLGQPNGEGPSAVIARLARAEEKRVADEKEQRKQERLARMRAFLAKIPPASEDERRATWEALDDLYDEDGLPK